MSVTDPEGASQTQDDRTGPSAGKGNPAGWQSWVAAGLVVAIVLGVLVVWGRPLYALVTDQARIQRWVEAFGRRGPAAIALLEMAQAIVAPFPGQAIELAGGLLYGQWLGTLYAMAGIVAGSTLAFLLARHVGRPLAERLAGQQAVSRLDDLAERGGSLFFFLLWLLPFVPDDLACLAAGLTEMPTRQFLVLMTLGRLPGILTATWVGAHARQVSPAVWLALILGGLLLALGFWRWGETAQSAMLGWVARLSARETEKDPKA